MTITNAHGSPDGLLMLTEPSVESEWFTLTPILRLAVLDTNPHAEPILQQMEQGSLGTVRWRAVEVVGVPMAEYAEARAQARK